MVALGGVATISGASVLLSARAASRATRRNGTVYRLLRPGASRQALADLPPLSEQRHRIADALTAGAQDRDPPDWPETLHSATARTLRSIMAGWGADGIADLSDSDVTELALLLALFRASPGDAGRLSALFQRPGALLGLRDELAAIGARRARFERQRDTFEATRAIWIMRRGTRPAELRDSLERMALPDPDLWHHIVSGHDSACPAQARAALWCVQQSACDRATVALFLRRIFAEDRLSGADPATRAALRRVIKLWNSGWYCTQEIGLSEPPETEAAKDKALAQLQDLAQNMGEDRWPAPFGIFESMAGRAVKPRDNWCLVTGTLTAPPRIEDYLDSDTSEDQAA